jgi:hypothetical protein
VIRVQRFLRVAVSLAAALLFGTLTVASIPPAFAEQRPRVFITDSESWEIVGSAGGSGGTFASHTQGGARPQTAEIIKTFGERCQQVLVNNKQEKADYVVVLDHEGGKGYLRRLNKVAVFNKDGDAVVSRSTRSLGNSVQDACDAIVADWNNRGNLAPSPVSVNALLQESAPKTQVVEHSVQVAPATKRGLSAPVRATPAPEIVEANTKTSSSVGTVSITSDPDGAEIFIDSVEHGHAPAILKLSGGRHSIQLVQLEYRDWTSNLEVKENSIACERQA